MIPKQIQGRDINFHTPFGPVIMETQISDELHEILLRRADQLRDGTHPNKDINTETNDYRGRLAGCLSEEYSYAKAFTKEEGDFVQAELTFLAANYTACAFKSGKIKKNGVRNYQRYLKKNGRENEAKEIDKGLTQV